MRLLFSDVLVTDENHENHAKHVNIAVIGNTVEYVGEALPDGEFDRVISGNYLVIPGFYNAHCHSAMTLFRGLGGDLPLKHWLDEAILPAEDRLTPELVRLFSTEAIAEMIACGTVAFSDMYFLCTDTARAALDSGIKLNIARSVVSFDEDADPAADYRVAEALELYREFHQKLIDSKSLPNQTDGNYYIEPLNYYLKDGTHVCRLYMLPYSNDLMSDPDSAIGALDRLLNCPELIAQRVGSSIPVTEESISTAYLSVENIGDDGSYLNDTVRLTPAQAYELYTECILPDAEDGTIGLRFASDTEEIRLRTTNVWIYMEMSEFVGRSANAYSDYIYDYISINLLTDSARTYKWITENTSVEPIDGYLNINYGKY